MNCRFYREIAAFFGKYIFNIHLFVLNVHFFIFNVHLYEDFDYEVLFSRSKASFWETLPNILLFREYLFAGSYSLHERVHLFRCFESVHHLKSDCRTPSITFISFIRFRLPQIFLKRVFFHIHYLSS